MTQTEMSDIFLGSRDSSAIVRKLYQMNKRHQPKFSLSYICKEARIPSKGYLSDIISGRRKLNDKYLSGLSKTFRLSKSQSIYLRTMTDLEHELNSERRLKLRKKIEILKRVLRIERPQMPLEMKDPTFLLELFCRFGLFGNKTNLTQLQATYPKKTRSELNEALTALVKAGLLRRDGPQFQIIKDEFVFGAGNNNELHLQFLKEMILRAVDRVDSCFKQKEETYLESCFISVNFENYKAKLQEIKHLFSQCQSELENGNADRLVAFNIQVFPID